MRTHDVHAHSMRIRQSVCESAARPTRRLGSGGMHALRASDSRRRKVSMTLPLLVRDRPALCVEAIRSCSGLESHCWVQR